ncbi:MAG TPA: alpha/beta hydrolase, partial [Acidimicrobiales bacterium]|nr:alpha/beta hydrolase [Acidimicrobiales bacterium]
WDGVAEVVAGGDHPVAAVDQRGHGRSDKPDDGYDFGTLTDDLAAVVDAMGWSDRPVVAAGQSWGGNVVVELAARRRDALTAIALVDGGTIELQRRFADWPTCEAALTPPAFEGMALADWERVLRRRHADWPESGIQGTLANVQVLADGTVRPRLSRRHHLTILRQLWEHRPSLRFPDLTVPVLLVPAGDPTGRAPRYESAKREEVAAAEAALPVHATRWIDGDHDLHAQHPDLVAGLLAGAADGSVFAA